MIPTGDMIRAHKEVLLNAVKRGEADCAYAFLGGVRATLKTQKSC
jgi:hypothetical protein